MLVIDNYDSFVYNLVQYLGELGAEPVVHRHDQVTLPELEALAPDAVLVSPGPGRPEDAGVSNDAIRAFGEQGVPVLASDGEQVGTVHHVVAAPEKDIFHGLVIALCVTWAVWRLRFVVQRQSASPTRKRSRRP